MEQHKSKLKLGILVIVILLLLGVVPNLFTFNNKKTAISEAFKSASGMDLQIDGDVKFSLLPTPRVKLKRIVVTAPSNEKLTALRIDFYTGPFAIFTGGIDIQKLKLYNAELKLSQIRQHIGGSEEAKSSPRLNIKSIELVNSAIVFDDETSDIERIKNINAKISYGGITSTSFKIDSDFILGTTRYNFDSVFSDIDKTGASDDASFKLYNDAFNISFEGKLTDLFEKPKLNGKTALILSNFEQLKDRIALGESTRKILTQEKPNIQATLSMSDTELKLSNIIIDSKSLTNGAGDLTFSYLFNKELSLNVSIDKVDLNSMLNAAKTDEEESVTNKIDTALQSILQSFDFKLPAHISALLNFKIKEISYNNQKIEGFKINADLFDGDLILNDFSFKMPGESGVRITGAVKHNKIRPKFKGNIAFISKKFQKFSEWLQLDITQQGKEQINKIILKSNISLIPRSLKFYNIKTAIGNTLLIGKSSFRKTGDKRINANLAFRINQFDFNTYGTPQKIDDIVYTLFLYDSDKSGDKNIRLTNDFRWIRAFPLDLNLELTVDNLMYKDIEFSKVYSSTRISRNKLSIDRISANSELAEFDGFASLVLPAFRPKLNLDINFTRFDSQILKKLFPSYGGMHAALTQQHQTELRKSLKEKDPGKKRKDISFFVSDFNFFSLHNYDGEIKIKAKDLKYDDLKLNNLKVDAELTEGVINLRKVTANVFKGKADLTGHIVIMTQIPNFSFSFALNNFNPSELLGQYSGYSGIDGYVSASGSVNTSGPDVSTVFSKLRGSASVIGKKLVWEGFDLGEIVRLPEINLNLPEKMKRLDYFSRHGESLFDSMQGKIKISNGIASLQNFSLGNNRAKGVYVATLDIRHKLINGAGKFSFIPIGDTDPITIDTHNKGLLSNQEFKLTAEGLTAYLTSQADLSGQAAKEKEERTRSLLRNRRR